MANEGIRVVFDCNVIWQAFFSDRGPAARCKELVDAGRVTLCLSSVVLEEMRDVLTRPKTQARFPKATSQVVDAFLQHFANLARFEKSVPRKFTSTRDPKDEPYINLALVAKATYVVSRDKDLLDLMRWDTDEGRDFQKRFRTIKVVSPEAFLDIVKAL